MEKYGFLFGRLCHGHILHCTSRFSSASMFSISLDQLICRRPWFLLAGLVASVGFSSVSPGGFVKKSVVSFITPTWAEPLGFTPASMMSLSHTHDTAYGFHNIPAGLQIFLLLFGARGQFLRSSAAQTVLHARRGVTLSFSYSWSSSRVFPSDVSYIG